MEDVSVRENAARFKPVIIAPVMLVATNVIASNISEVRIVPKMPASNTGRILHTQWKSSAFAVKTNSKRYKTAIPKAVHKNAGATVIVAL